jgi:hypothetical protein
MELRKLKALLAALNATGVTKYDFEGLKLELSDRIAPVQLEEGDVEGIGDLRLPADVPDPRVALREIYTRDAKRRGVKARAS